MRLPGIAISLLAVGALAYLVVVHGLAEAAASSGRYHDALRLNPRSGDAAARIAERLFDQNRRQEAAAYAKRAIKNAPLNVRAVRTLGLAWILSGPDEAGGQLMLRAGALGWRDTRTQLWIIQQAAYQGDYSTFVERADGLLRRERAGTYVLRALHMVAHDPKAREVILQRLLEAPPWRGQYFSKLQSLPREGIASHLLLLAELKKNGLQIGRPELAPFIFHLISQGEFATARSAWLQLAAGASAGQRPGSIVNDSDFSAVPPVDDDQPAYPFEWKIRDGKGGFAAIEAPPMALEEKSLMAQSDGSGGSVLAEQTLILPPGRYRLSFDFVSQPADAIAAFKWVLACPRKAGVVEGELTPGASVGAWRKASVDLALPGGRCPAPILQLRTARWEGRGNAQVWVDRVTIAPSGG